MPDDLTNKGPQDRSRISLLEPHEVQYWADRFNVSKERLSEAVKNVGHYPPVLIAIGHRQRYCSSDGQKRRSEIARHFAFWRGQLWRIDALDADMLAMQLHARHDGDMANDRIAARPLRPRSDGAV